MHPCFQKAEVSMSTPHYSHSTRRVVAIEQLHEKYTALKDQHLTSDERAFADRHEMRKRELMAKIHTLVAVRGKETVRSVFRAASSGETGLFEDAQQKAYISGGFDRVMRAMMTTELRRNADPVARAYIDKINRLEAQAFMECEDHRKKVGETLKEMPLERTEPRKAEAATSASTPQATAAAAAFSARKPPAAPTLPPKQPEQKAARPHRSFWDFLHRHRHAGVH
jgi:hypothetical protein